MHSFPSFVARVVVCLVVILAVTEARPGPQTGQNKTESEPKKNTTQAQIVLEGIAGTGLAKPDGHHDHAHSSHRRPGHYSAPTITQSCDKVECETHEDCAVNGCGGHFCASCPSCLGHVAGVCVWDPATYEKSCPPLDCHSEEFYSGSHAPEPEDPHGHGDVHTHVIIDEQEGYKQNKTELERLTDPQVIYASADMQMGPFVSQASDGGSPWESSFSDLKGGKDGNKKKKKKKKSKKQKQHDHEHPE